MRIDWTRPPTVDVVLAGTLVALAQVELWLPHAASAPPTPAQILVTVMLTAPMAWRRPAALPVGLGILTLFALQPLLMVQPNLFVPVVAVLIAIFGIAAYPTSTSAAIVGGTLAVALSAMWSVFAASPDNEAVANGVFTALVWGCGAVVRRHANRVRASRAAVARAHAESDTRIREVIAEERARIARELHDIVAHSIGVVVLQARGGRRMLDLDPDEARQAFTAIEQLSAQSLAEMRRLLGVLHEHADPATHTVPVPRPGLHDLDRLVEHVRAAGLAVDVTVRGARRELPPGLDLSAYRIIQEALTNVLRHVLDAHAQLLLSYTTIALDIEVIDNGRTQSEPVPGHGLIGMRERAELFGGTLESGPHPGGGFAVRAHLPTPELAR